jgi:GT2 family glycosyltransferase
MVKKIQIFITHYVSKELIFLNDLLVEQVTFLEKITEYPHETIIVYYSPDGSASELSERLPPNIKLVNDDIPVNPDGAKGSVPSGLNRILRMAEDYFIVLQNDIRVSKGWLECLVRDFEAAEGKYGKRCIMSMRFIPYHYIPGIITPKYPELWKFMETYDAALSIDKMQQWANKWKFDFTDGMLYSILSKSEYTDDGHMLMMFMSSKNCFDISKGGIGDYDETFLGWGYGDSDMGIRALMKGFKNLQSVTCFIGHLQGFTTTQPKYSAYFRENNNLSSFVKKWGQDIFDEMQTGQLWIRLHKEQG